MTKLHELLAVAGDTAATQTKINEEAKGTFSKKPELFLASTTSVLHLAESEKELDTEESKEMTTTVADKLKYIVRANVRALDVYLQKEAANQKAVGDIIIDGKAIAEKVPATALLGLETKLAELRKVYEAIPTLAPGPKWEIDSQRGVDVYRSSAETKFRTRKTLKPVLMHPPTEHHPAQVQAVNEDVPVARIVEQKWSGMLTSAQKSDLLERIDQLIRAVKRARQRANMETVEKREIGNVLFKHIHEGIIV